jgi:hypothetical protein
MPGPDEEVAWVGKMYRWLIEEDLTFREIADRLNDDGVTTDLDRPWNSGTVRTVLTNEKYIGNNVYNRSSFKLKKLHVDNPPDMWVRKEGAFEGIVPLEFFLTAQEIITARSARLSDEELLEHLKRRYADAGQLSGVLIDQTPDMPSSSAYRNRFGSLARAYEMIGYRSDRDQERIALNKRLRALHPEIIARTEAAIADVGGTVARDPKTDLLTINDEMVVSLVLARCQPMADGRLRWRIRFDPMRYQDSRLVGRLSYNTANATRKYVNLSREIIISDSITLKDSLQIKIPDHFNGTKTDWVQQEFVYELLEKGLRKPLSKENFVKDIEDLRKKMLKNVIDVSEFMVWFIENYPQSSEIMKNNPKFQDRFK